MPRRRDWFALGLLAGCALTSWLYALDERDFEEAGQRRFAWVPACRICGHSTALHDRDGGCHATIYLVRDGGEDARPCRCPETAR